MFQGEGQTIVYSSQLDDGLLHHHPVAVLEGSEACHKEVLPAGIVLLLLLAAELSGSLRWLSQRHSSLLPVAWCLNHRETQSALGGKGHKAVSFPDLSPRSSNTSFPQQHQFFPQSLAVFSQSPTRPQTTNTNGNKRPRRQDQASTHLETQARWEIPVLPAKWAASRSRVPVLPLSRSSHSPARPRCPGDSHT